MAHALLRAVSALVPTLALFERPISVEKSLDTARMGACATSTGVFSNYALIPVNQVIPVDVYVPGCPPRPEQLIYAIMLLQKKIESEKGTTMRVLNLA